MGRPVPGDHGFPGRRLPAGRPEDPGARPQALRHRQPVLHPSREAYVGMSLFYAEDEAMRAFHDSYHPGMVEFLGAAIRVFAEQGSGFAPSAGAEASA
ncbi:TipAS antibiotic-recognition domain-containing protein [Streptomyces sp. PanSC9]|uniref:TipAS antibiotic-recognition domain-containing protein n=1 Tax=Streptomyces sp. PanSC9 TaxID=1520461 RepID=UPI0021A51B96|nr:TipAS antibiotic-recognition domain-containing protein [Streptomyces sp. PanSC9]